MPVADFAKLSVSAGTPERQEVSTLPVLPPILEQAAPQDVEMAVAEPETEDVLGETELMFGKPHRDLMPAEEVQYQQYQKEWLTSRQPQVDPIQEWVQIAEGDRRVQRDQELQIRAGSVAELIFHLHLQEPTPTTTIQLQRLVNEVRTMKLDMLIQRTARLELPPAVPLREQLRLHREWAGKPSFVRPQTFSRPLFAMSFSRILSEWGTM